MLSPLTPHTARALLSPSARVLAASAESDGGLSRVHDLPWSDVHWPTFVSLTSFERAAAQVFRLLRAAPVGAVPDDVTSAMQRIYRVAVFRSDELGDAAAVACDVLRHAGVPALWLKGAALAMQSGEEFAVRSMGDLDVLVPSDAQVAARRALVAAGWTEGVHDPTYDAHHHEAPLFWRAGIRLELHDGLFPPGHPFADEPAEAWLARGVAATWGTRQVRVLPPAWHVVHASVHWAWNHEGEIGTWQYLHDLQRLAGGWPAGGGEWAAVIDAAHRISATRPAGWALWTGARLGRVAIDEGTIARLRGASRFLTPFAEREWVLRAFHSTAASPSVAWSRFWWRKSMAGLGDAVGSWPWAVGRAADVAAAAPEGAAVADQAGTPRRALARWRRHLGRVLRG